MCNKKYLLIAEINFFNFFFFIPFTFSSEVFYLKNINYNNFFFSKILFFFKIKPFPFSEIRLDGKHYSEFDAAKTNLIYEIIHKIISNEIFFFYKNLFKVKKKNLVYLILDRYFSKLSKICFAIRTIKKDLNYNIIVYSNDYGQCVLLRNLCKIKVIFFPDIFFFLLKKIPEFLISCFLYSVKLFLFFFKKNISVKHFVQNKSRKKVSYIFNTNALNTFNYGVNIYTNCSKHIYKAFKKKISKIFYLHQNPDGGLYNKRVIFIQDNIQIKDIKLFLVFIRSLKNINSFTNLFISWIFFKDYVKIFLTVRRLKKYPYIKYFFVDWDLNFPQYVFIALNLLKKKSIAVQDRFLMSVYNNSYNGNFNFYFSSSFFEKKNFEKKNNDLNKKFFSVGQYRSDYFRDKDAINKKLLEKIIQKKIAYKKLILVLPYHHSFNNEIENSLDPLQNYRSSINFLYDIIKLSKRFKHCFFFIKVKSYNGYDDIYFKKVINLINQSENIYFFKKNVLHIQYKIFKNVSVVIGKYTSLIDEYLSKNKPCLIHDYTHNLNSNIGGTFNYFNSGIICKNYFDLRTKLALLLDNRNNYLKKNLKKLIKKIYSTYNPNELVIKKIITLSEKIINNNQ